MRPQRRAIRLSGYDYTQPGAYFVTICCAHRGCLLGRIEDQRIILSLVGGIVRDCWEAIPRHFLHARVDLYVVMPNHLHGILVLSEAGRGTPWRAPTGPLQEVFGRPRSRSLSTIVRMFKAASTRALRQAGILAGEHLWQRGFYDRVVRDDAELERIRLYIEENPIRWAEDEYHTERP